MIQLQENNSRESITMFETNPDIEFSLEQPQCSGSLNNNDDIRSGESAIFHSTKLCLGGEWVNIPSILIANESIFRSVMSKESFNSLSQVAKNHLKRFLPQSEENNFDDLLNCTFTKDKNFCFGNPLDKFYEKFRNGFFTGADHVQLRDHKRVLYDHYIRHYQMNLLKKLLVNRHTTLEQASKLPPTEPLKIAPKLYSSKGKLDKYNNVKRRAKIRAKRMIDDCRIKADQIGGISSDESIPEDDSTVFPVTSNARSTMFTDKYSTADLDLYQPIRMKEVSELYQEYCYLRETEPDCPSLDISDITLEEVYERTGISFQTERNFSKITEQNLAHFVGKRVSKQKIESTIKESEMSGANPSGPRHEISTRQ